MKFIQGNILPQAGRGIGAVGFGLFRNPDCRFIKYPVILWRESRKFLYGKIFLKSLSQMLVLGNFGRNHLIFTAIIFPGNIFITAGFLTPFGAGINAPGLQCLTAIVQMDYYSWHSQQIKNQKRYDKEFFHPKSVANLCYFQLKPCYNIPVIFYIILPS